MTTLTSQASSSSSTSPGLVEAVTVPARGRNDHDATRVKQRAMLDGPVLPTLLKLALPTVVVLVVQTLVGVAETYFVSFLGTEAIAGVSLVFPIFMLMQMMSNGGIGGGVASSIARAIGADRVAEAEALALNALVLAVVFGVSFAGTEWLFGEAVYRLLGGQAGALGAALEYGHIVFLGAVFVWIVSLLAAALRGAGNTVAPAAVILLGVFVLLPLSPALIFGWGPFPKLGVAGAGVAVVVYYLVGSIILIGYLRSAGASLRLPFDVRLITWRRLGDILRVGGLSAVGTVQSNLTVVLVTGAVGLFGTDAIAGYGIASRLDYIQIPILFALGSAALTMVGVNIGSGQISRAERIAWVAALFAAAVTELLGVVVTVFPHAWLTLFSTKPEVVAAGSIYFRTVAPFYGFTGFGLLLYFAGQGAGHVIWPVLGGTVRLLVAAGIGWIVVADLGGGLRELFIAVAAGSIVSSAIVAGALWLSGWGQPARLPNSSGGK
jgi:MATE family, multidrug efflux pump